MNLYRGVDPNGLCGVLVWPVKSCRQEEAASYGE